MAELAVNGTQAKDDVLAGPHEQEVKEMEKQATSLDSGVQQQQQQPQQPFADPQTRPQPGQQQQQQQVLSASGLAKQLTGDNTLETVKQWSVSAYKCTKQLMSEKMGKSSRTIDTEVDPGIASLRESQKRYQCLLNLANSLMKHFQSMLETQRVMSEAFREMAKCEPNLSEEFSYNASTQLAITANGQQLLSALELFCNTLNTLVNKTFDDTLITIANYEHARIEYDAYRTELDAAMSQKDASASNRVDDLQRKYESLRQRYDRLKEDVKIKMQLLDENKIRVMQKQLLLFHNAVSAYFSGNQAALEATMKQFSLKPKTGCAEKQAFLERRQP